MAGRKITKYAGRIVHFVHNVTTLTPKLNTRIKTVPVTDSTVYVKFISVTDM